jgi:transposase
VAEAFQPILTAWGNWEEQILGYFDHQVTNAYTESMNNLIRAVSRLGRGYSFEVLRAKMLFSSGLHITARPKFIRMRDDVHAMRMMTTSDLTTIRDTRARSLGVSISTLAEKIDAGEFASGSTI